MLTASAIYRRPSIEGSRCLIASAAHGLAIHEATVLSPQGGPARVDHARFEPSNA